MGRALVLGGGGPVGIAWQAGLLVGLADSGVDLSGADAIIGTSAGAAVGAQLALGLDLGASAERVASAISRNPEADVAARGAPAGLSALMSAMVTAVQWEGPPEQARQQLGRLSVHADTFPEETFVALFDDLAGYRWPARFSCTAVDTDNGLLRVWDADAGVELCRAVASSCAVPALYPPVTIAGRSYMDGGTRSSLNADLACEQEVVVAVSVTPLSLPPAMSNPLYDRILLRQQDEFDALRAAGAALTLVEPDEEFLAVSDWGLSLLDPGRMPAAMDAGARLGRREASRLLAAWEGDGR